MASDPVQSPSVSEVPGGAKAPWSPMGIALVTLVLSPLPGGILHAINYGRLGAAERKRLALASNLITTVPFFLLAFYTAGWGYTEGWGRVLTYLAAMTLASYFYKSQEYLFRRHRSAGGQKASLLLPVVFSAIVTVLLAVGLSYAEAIGHQISHQRNFEEALGLMKDGKGEEAEKLFRAYQKNYPEEMESYWNLALIYEEAGHTEAAKQELRAFLARSPDSPEVKEYLAGLESSRE